VCKLRGHTVDIVSEDGRKVTTLLDCVHGIDTPHALCYCASKEALFVSNIDGKSISVYNLSKQ